MKNVFVVCAALVLVSCTEPRSGDATLFGVMELSATQVRGLRMMEESGAESQESDLPSAAARAYRCSVHLSPEEAKACCEAACSGPSPRPVACNDGRSCDERIADYCATLPDPKPEMCGEEEEEPTPLPVPKPGPRPSPQPPGKPLPPANPNPPPPVNPCEPGEPWTLPNSYGPGSVLESRTKACCEFHCKGPDRFCKQGVQIYARHITYYYVCRYHDDTENPYPPFNPIPR